MTKTIDNLITQNVRIREEMHAMRLELNALRYQHVVDSSSNSPMLPVRFPMQTVEDIQLLNMKLEDGETYLLLVNYLSKLGGKSVSDCISNLMKSTMTDDLASNINWRGVNSRFSLASTVFASAIVETVMKHQRPKFSSSKSKLVTATLKIDGESKRKYVSLLMVFPPAHN
ncbi:hypothetical protein EG68_09030 [Paragonimus skrjabini miyazakii]|uniref:DUF4806 domain-containing protein n=1 Tax=Paragonimus skrjabini miyazakii TaxID=59628 RepID=A0A8S9YNR1_9TREM|nr:hypothetical protein EG68_09030 [Paragonimus skrjabini miyazakii]